jgi:hypothetical protein
VLFEAHFTKLEDDQFLTALAWGIASLQNADDPRARSKEQGCSSRLTQEKTWPFATQCGMLLPVLRALVFGFALCFLESINLT